MLIITSSFKNDAVYTHMFVIPLKFEFLYDDFLFYLAERYLGKKDNSNRKKLMLN